MRPWTTRLVSILCVLALAVSVLAVPAFARPAMKGGEVRETPLGEEAAAALAGAVLEEGVPAGVGRMPDRPQAQDEEAAAAVQAVLMAATEVTTADYTQNFTASGTKSSFYEIKGNLATNKGTVSYAGLTLTQCLKLESATTVTFNAPAAGTLTLVFVEAAPTIKLDGTKHTGTGQVMTLEVSAGSHTLSKGDTANLFYLVYATGSGNSSDNGHTCVWGPYTQAVAPTCSKVGKETARCTVTGCDKTNTRDVAKLDHSFKDGVCSVCGARNGAVVGGWFESFYAEMAGVSASDVTGVSWSGTATGSLGSEDLKYLVRNATLADGKTTGTRIDVPGVKPGTYTVTISKGTDKFISKDIKVMAYDRSGYAHKVVDASGIKNYTEGVGAYNDDGTLKSNAVVLYVTNENKNSVKLTVGSTTVTGIGNILNTAGKSQNGNKDILKLLANANTPLVVRIVGRVQGWDGGAAGDKSLINGLTANNSATNGGTAKDNGFMARMQSAANITIEGIGTDAVIDGWGLHFIRSSGDKSSSRGRNFELRNLTFRNVPEDCVGMEGTGDAMETPVEHCWVHNCEFYVPNIPFAVESDKHQGDGACDFKRGQYHTMSYCYYEGYHKTNLIGSSDKVEQYHITWHHNYYKDCESRGPLARQANLHIYNSIYAGQTNYCQNPRANCYIFSEYNLFTGSDKTSTSKNPGQVTSGGVIKSYQDKFESVRGNQQATVVTSRSKTVTSANKYANFDTDPALSYIPDGNYLLDTSIDAAKAKIEAYCGVMKAAAGEVSGGAEEEPTPTVHTHAWSSWAVTTAATCTAEGVKTRTCSAPDCTVMTQTQSIPATGHSWSGWKVTTDPTCITAGAEERQCATCGTKETRAVAATGEHTFVDGTCSVSGCGVKDPNYDPGGGSASGTGYRHSFTASDINSDFYTFTGNLASDKGTVNYGGQALTKCLKLETATQVKFTAPADGTLTLVFVEAAPTIKLDGTNHTGTGQVMTLDLSAGAHTLTKANTANLFYLAYEPSGGGGGTGGTEHTCSNFKTVGAADPDCTKTGYTGDEVCTECGKVKTKGTVIPALGHTWSGGECSVCHMKQPTAGAGKFTKTGGWFETAYAQWSYIAGATSYNVYCKKVSDGDWGSKVDDELIRQYPSYLRVDVPGLAEGQYVIRVVPCSGGSELTGSAMETGPLNVRAHDRSGFAYQTGGSPGAYKADGTLKTGAEVVYITEETKDTVKLAVNTDGKGEVECTGIQNILLGFKKRKDTRPLCVRVIGNITDPAVLTKGDLYIDGAGNGITIEGIGTDATINGFGIVMKGATNVEVRNLGFMNCNSDEGDSLGLQQANDHIWTHNNDYFYGDAGSDADQVKGDGSLDTKKSTYVTHSYNHFWDSGKTHLQGMKDEVEENYITYHHNWYDHSDSRHPRVRTCTVHVYNNYFDGNSKYGVGATLAANIFVEKNYFRSTATLKPMMISMQGTDIAGGVGTFSKENGGMIKSFDNIMVGKSIKYAPYSAANPVEFDAYEAKSRNEQVPSAITTKQGGHSYSNFDTNSSLMYTYVPDSPANVPAEVEGWSGRMEGGDLQWPFTDADDGEYLVADALKAKLTGYKTSLVKVGSAVSASGGSASEECGHANTRLVTVQTASCATAGEQAEVCVDCGATVRTKPVPATGHSPRWVITTPPTCADKGWEVSACAVCGAEFGDPREVAATGSHTYDSSDTCTECGASKPSGGGADPTPPTPQGTKYVLDAKKDLYETRASNGTDKNSKPIYTCAAAETLSGGTDGFFTVYCAAGTKLDYSLKIFGDDEEGTASYDYTSDYRINFSDAAAVVENVPSNAIAFTPAGDATVEVWWVQAGQDGTREIVILNSAGKQVDVTMGDGYVQNDPYYSILHVPAGGPYYLGGTPGKNYIFKVEVTVADAASAPEQADKTALTEAIASAEHTKTTAIVCDEGGSDVSPDQDWVTQDVMDALIYAIAVAQTVADDATATQARVDAAKDTLAAAEAAFTAAKAPGTLRPEPEPDGDKIFLLDVTDAETQTSGSVDGHVYVGGYYTVGGTGTTAGGGDFLLTAKGLDKGWIEFKVTGTKAVIKVWASSTKATDNKSPLGLWDPAQQLVTGDPDITFVTGDAEPEAPSVTYTVTAPGVYRLGSPTDAANKRGVRIYQVEVTETGSAFCDHDSAFDLLDATPVSCTVDGKSSDVQCRKCGQTVESGTIIPRTGHTFNDAGKCTGCGIDRPDVGLKLVFDGGDAAVYDGYVISHLALTNADDFTMICDGSTLSDHLKLDGAAITFRAPDAGTATLLLSDNASMNGMTLTVNGNEYTVADNKVSFKTSANTNYVLDRTGTEQPRIFAVEWTPDDILDSTETGVTDLHWSYTAKNGVITSVKITDPERIDPDHGVYVACWKNGEFLDVKLINSVYDEVDMPEGCTGFKLIWLDDRQVPQSVNAQVGMD